MDIKTLRIFVAAVSLTALTITAASALTLNLSGTLTTADPTFNRPNTATALSTTGTATAYDFFTFTADNSGAYSISGDYTAGGTNGLDGYLFLYTTFNPASALTNLQAADDDNDPDGAGAFGATNGSLIPSTGSYGPATTTTALTLTPGTTYTLVVSSFYNANNANGRGVGPYSVTITGATVPEPSTLAAVAAGTVGLAGVVLRRRRRG